MIKVMWFLKKADHLSLEEFKHWWLNTHVFDICADQKPHVKKYVVDIRIADDSAFDGRPSADAFGWDGIAEQYFDTVEDYNAIYSRKDRPTRADTLAHTKAFQRMVVEQFEIDPATGNQLS